MNKYYGEMKDGSVLPNWIKVDPKTGKTTTNIPKGIQMLEFKIVAVDVDNNQKKVTVVIDPKKIMQDKDVFNSPIAIDPGDNTIYMHESTAANQAETGFAESGAVDIGFPRSGAVSYTHLTLPTTP